MPSIQIPKGSASSANDQTSDSQDSAQESTQSSTVLSSASVLPGSTPSTQSSSTSFADYDIPASLRASVNNAPATQLLTASAASGKQHSPLIESQDPDAPQSADQNQQRPRTPPCSEVREDASSAPAPPSDASPESGSSSLSPVRGTKRTASGDPKAATLLAPTVSREEHHVPYSALSAESPRRIRAKQAVERMQLKLRLAQFKVTHGLADKSMDEIDEMMSQPGTPASMRSPTCPSAYTSPRASAISATRHTRNVSSITSTTDLMSRLDTASASAPLTAPYHGHHRLGSLERNAGASRPSLAPPPDLGSAPHLQYRATDRGPSRAYSRVSTPTPRERDALESLQMMAQMATPGSIGARRGS